MQLPLLSICIPTYNRAEYLRRTLDSIVSQDGFAANCEIVISDNSSTDNTEGVCRNYIQKYSNIKYFKNNENIADRNFPLVLSRGNGVFRKLCNDTLLFNDGALKSLLEIVQENQDKMPVVFTNNQGETESKCDGLEAFLRTVSFNITWIGGLCVWGSDFEFTEEGCSEKLWQVPFLLRYISNKKKVFVSNKRLFTTQVVEKKNISYGLYKVFYVNYLGFIKKYLQAGALSQDCFDWLEKDLLFNFFPNWMVQYKLQNNQLEYSKSEDLIQCIKDSYKSKSYYIKFLIIYRFSFLKVFVKKILHKYKRKVK